MKKEYQKPLCEILMFDREDVVTTSGEEKGVQWDQDWSDALDNM